VLLIFSVKESGKFAGEVHCFTFISMIERVGSVVLLYLFMCFRSGAPGL
jgi:hypothetical protein